MEVESILGSPKTRPFSGNTGHGCPLLGASRWPLVPCPGSPVGACMGCSAVGVPEGECAGSSPSAAPLDAGAGGPGSRADEDLKPVPCLGTIRQGVHPASHYLSDLPFLFQLLLLQWLLDSLGAEVPLCPLPVLQDEGFVAATAWYKPVWCALEFITAACQPGQPGQTWTRRTSLVPLPRSTCVFRRGERGWAAPAARMLRCPSQPRRRVPTALLIPRAWAPPNFLPPAQPCQPTACRLVQVPGLSMEAALTPPAQPSPGQI